MIQQRLQFDRDPHGCNHGVPLMNRCAECVEETKRYIEEFRQAVARGELDVEGYSPSERRGQNKKAAA